MAALTDGQLKDLINGKIRPNKREAISGESLNEVLQQIRIVLAGAGGVDTNISTDDLVLPTGARKLNLGGSAYTDYFAFQKSDNSNYILKIEGDDKVLAGGFFTANANKTGNVGLAIYSKLNAIGLQYFNSMNQIAKQISEQNSGLLERWYSASQVLQVTHSASGKYSQFYNGWSFVGDTTTGIKFLNDPAQKGAFWGATPVAQQVLATGAGNTVDDVISALQTIGLFKQS